MATQSPELGTSAVAGWEDCLSPVATRLPNQAEPRYMKGRTARRRIASSSATILPRGIEMHHEHDQHEQAPTSAVPDHAMTMPAMDGGRRPRPARGPLGRDVPRQVLAEPRADDPGRAAEPRRPGVARLHRARVPGHRSTLPAILGTIVFLYGGLVFIRGARRRAARPAARDDDPDLARDHRRVRHQLGRHARPVRGRDLVGARDPHHDHAARPLARDALDRPGARRADRPSPSCCPTRRSGSRRRAPRRSRSRRSPSATSSSSGPARASRPTASSSRATPTSTSR